MSEVSIANLLASPPLHLSTSQLSRFLLAQELVVIYDLLRGLIRFAACLHQGQAFGTIGCSWDCSAKRSEQLEIHRSGARHFGKQHFLVDGQIPIKVSWDEASDQVQLGARNVPDIHNPEAQYDYDVFLSMPDLALTLEAISTNGIQHVPREVQTAFQQSVLHLLRLLGCATGMVPAPLPLLGHCESHRTKSRT